MSFYLTNNSLALGGRNNAIAFSSRFTLYFFVTLANDLDFCSCWLTYIHSGLNNPDEEESIGKKDPPDTLHGETITRQHEMFRQTEGEAVSHSHR